MDSPTPPPLPSKPNPSPITQQKTFTRALSNVSDIPQSQLLKPCVKGVKMSIIISEEEYEAGLDAC